MPAEDESYLLSIGNLFVLAVAEAQENWYGIGGPKGNLLALAPKGGKRVVELKRTKSFDPKGKGVENN